MTPRIGSLFSGYGGLDMGVQQVIGGEVVWHVEFDDAPSRILKHHWPDVPNYGDITAVDWETVPPVDVLTGGFPCQDVSLAGARKGLMDGTRSGLWSEFAKAISVLRPSLVVIENVRGLLSAKTVEDISEEEEANADLGTGEAGDLELDTGGVGELGRGDRPILNAFGRVLGDLAELGYDASWVGVRAADAGAPHGRYRIFVLAYPASARRSEGQVARASAGDASARVRGLESERGRRERPGATEDAYFAARSEWGQSTPGQAESGRARADFGGRSGAPVADASSGGRDGRAQVEVGFPLERTVPTGVGADALADARGERFGEYPGEPSAEETGPGSGDLADGVGRRRADTDWGPYAPAIERWERTIGRLAPAPTNADGKNDSHRLSAQFVEWMMGLPAGHVTDPAIGLTRNQQLKALGNGVVPQQAALAVTHLLQRKERAA